MRAVVTILQCRRVVLPYLFVKYVAPEMRRLFPGSFEVVIVQHRADVRSDTALLGTQQTPADQLGLVERWTREGRYAGAEVIQHAIEHPAYPSIPSYHLAARAALERRADFHLWLEDDAIVFDQGCARWPELLRDRDVGVYRDFHHVNSAYFVSRRSYDERIVAPLSAYEAWTWRRRIEPFLARQARAGRAQLPPEYAVRHHAREYPYCGLRYVVDFVRRWCPEELALLEIDFGPGVAASPPVRADELAAQVRRQQRLARRAERWWGSLSNGVLARFATPRAVTSRTAPPAR